MVRLEESREGFEMKAIVHAKPGEIVVRGRSCPRCKMVLRASHDMWGPFWLCDFCGFSIGGERPLVVERSKPPWKAA